MNNLEECLKHLKLIDFHEEDNCKALAKVLYETMQDQHNLIHSVGYLCMQNPFEEAYNNYIVYEKALYLRNWMQENRCKIENTGYFEDYSTEDKLSMAIRWEEYGDKIFVWYENETLYVQPENQEIAITIEFTEPFKVNYLTWMYYTLNLTVNQTYFIDRDAVWKIK